MAIELGSSDALPRQTWEIKPAPLAELSEEERAIAQQRFATLRLHLEDGVPLSRLAREVKETRRTLHRWLTRYREHGLAGLVNATRADRGDFHQDERLRTVIEGLALNVCPRAFVGQGCERRRKPVDGARSTGTGRCAESPTCFIQITGRTSPRSTSSRSLRI